VSAEKSDKRGQDMTSTTARKRQSQGDGRSKENNEEDGGNSDRKKSNRVVTTQSEGNHKFSAPKSEKTAENETAECRFLSVTGGKGGARSDSTLTEASNPAEVVSSKRKGSVEQVGRRGSGSGGGKEVRSHRYCSQEKKRGKAGLGKHEVWIQANR